MARYDFHDDIENARVQLGWTKPKTEKFLKANFHGAETVESIVDLMYDSVKKKEEIIEIDGIQISESHENFEDYKNETKKEDATGSDVLPTDTDGSSTPEHDEKAGEEEKKENEKADDAGSFRGFHPITGVKIFV